MKIKDIIRRRPEVTPWVEGEKIPWNDPALSRRILASHLSQDTDWASRRFDLIDRHIDWLNSRLKPQSRVLDLGCGPGFYTQRLAALGHECVGVDFSPASIEYAQKKAAESQAPIEYVLADIRDFRPQGRFDCVMMIFGEINVFSEPDARLIFTLAGQALPPGGLFVLEGHTYNGVRDTGLCPPTWWSAGPGEGILTDEAHLCLQENFWDEPSETATTRYYIINGGSSEADLFCSSMTAYSEEKYGRLFEESGFAAPELLSVDDWPVGDPFINQMLTFASPKVTP